MKINRILFFIACWFLMGPAVSGQTPLNETKILASHNSYKQKPHKRILRFLKRYKKKLGAENDPIQIDYGHELLSVQMDSFGVRGFELDLYNDPRGGHFRKRAINRFLIGRPTRSKDKRFKLPGFKLLHIPDVDFESNYVRFQDALLEINEWSSMHTEHLPIFINIECKNTSPGDESKALKRLGFKKAISFDAQAYQNLDREILSALPRSKIFTPQDLRSSFTSIGARLDSIGWPSEEELKGKIFFILDGHASEYLNSSIDTVLFHYGNPENNHTAFVIQNNPIGNEAYIASLTSKFMVRTRADAGTHEARKNDYTRFRSALQSGAQIISTDYYKADPRWSPYCIKIEP